MYSHLRSGEARTTKLRAQAFMAETEAAQKRGELIEKSLVARQAAFIFVSLRQSVLAFPSRYARRMVGLPSEHEAKQFLTRAAHEFLTELADRIVLHQLRRVARRPAGGGQKVAVWRSIGRLSPTHT